MPIPTTTPSKIAIATPDNGTNPMVRLLYLIAAIPCFALAALSLFNATPAEQQQQTAPLQAGAAASGYQKPGAAVRMFFTMPTDLQPGDSGVIHTTWFIDEPAAALELRISNESGLNVTAPEFVTIAQPTVGFEYTLDIPFTAEAGLHTLGFVSTTTADSGSSQSRSFGIAVEAGRPLPVQRKANNIADTDSGEKLVRMTAARQ